MIQLRVDDFCKCSFGVDNAVVFLCIRIITGNFDIVNMYNARKVKYLLFVYAKLFVYVQLGQSP